MDMEALTLRKKEEKAEITGEHVEGMWSKP
jgi:hypothetical protein